MVGSIIFKCCSRYELVLGMMRLTMEKGVTIMLQEQLIYIMMLVVVVFRHSSLRGAKAPWMCPQVGTFNQ